MLDISLLGTGGGMPMPNRYLSATLMSYKGRKILIDCGEGTQVSMRLLGWGFKTIDIICITHTHGDHIIGLPGLLGTIGNSGRVEPLTIIGPKGIKDVIDGLRTVVPVLPYEINVIENPLKPIMIKSTKESFKIEDNGDIILSTIELDHGMPCIGYNFYIKRTAKFNMEKAIENNVPKKLWGMLQKQEEVTVDGKIYYSYMVLGEERKGLKVSYITDSRPVEGLEEFIKDSNLFICEGTYGDDSDIEKAIKNKHMTFREAATLAKKGNVHKLLLTHFSSAMNEPESYKNNALEVFANTIIGEDRLVLNLKFEDR
ncbi:ribonuclease Z [Clostridium tarantellae]|uniref:Ribonuclease Z n=1 Tax=Clostridium tarantellae TaxID=39493 RepID=A0A6I1MKS9_9CLOT|nr:ribonuclease Z [Clostridium tarantellae]MPQ44005.1 ribonuclease Z [Clostridium tarantellae]